MPARKPLNKIVNNLSESHYIGSAILEYFKAHALALVVSTR